MRSLRDRLAWFGTGVVALALVVFGVLLYSLLARNVNTDQDSALHTRAISATRTFAVLPDAQPPVAPADLGRSTDVFLEVLAGDGSVLYTTALLNGTPPVPSPELLDKAGRSPGGVFATQGGLRLFVLPYAGGYVVTGQSTTVPRSNLSGVVAFLFISGSAALLAAMLASWLVAGRALRPLQLVARTAEEIGRTSDFARRLPPRRGKDEVARLTLSFNGMLSCLQEAFESQRRFVADASHELRTPLTTIQGNAGLLASREVSAEVRQEAVADLVQESGRMTRLVDRLLTLARADAGLDLQLADLDLGLLVGEVSRQAAASHATFTLQVESRSARVQGDEDALRQLLWILLDNAFGYAASTVSVRLWREGGWARLSVGDDGPGIPAEQRERVFERFYRADPSRAGSHAGLGLSIAAWIVTQHHGRIVVWDGPLGGAAFVVDLPLLRDS